MKKKLILLHGAIGSKEEFTSLTTKLNNQYDVLALNFPGHGQEPFSNELFSIELFCQHVLPYIESEKEPITLLGYSLGGYVALLLAAKYPDKIESVITFATIFDWSEMQSEKQIRQINPEKIEEKVPAFAKHLEKVHGSEWKKVLTNTHHLLAELGKNPLLNEEVFARINQKVIITVGDRDALVSIEESIKTYKVIKNASLAVFPNTGHPIQNLNMNYLADLLGK